MFAESAEKRSLDAFRYAFVYLILFHFFNKSSKEVLGHRFVMVD